MRKAFLSLSLVLTVALGSCQNKATTTNTNTNPKKTMETSHNKTDEEWKKILTPEQYHVLREKGTESPHSSELNDNFEEGTYVCAGCGTELFTSKQKFDGHCGWPSFDGEVGPGDRIKKIKDFSHGMIRTEIVCAKCGGHLGHIFDDGPTETGQRYCVNGLSIGFKKKEEKK
ncbi:MAG: peptide-methionine (R)-S-oxide reductase MsrB [Bacteroidia bacterium]